MSFTGVDAFDTTVHKTSVWLNEVMDEMHWSDRHRAYSTLRAVLHALRDRLNAEEAVDLGAQLPMLVRGFYYEGWRPTHKPLRYRSRKEFIDHVASELPDMDREDIELAATAVFRVLSQHVTGGELDQARAQLPSGVRELWH